MVMVVAVMRTKSGVEVETLEKWGHQREWRHETKHRDENEENHDEWHNEGRNTEAWKQKELQNKRKGQNAKQPGREGVPKAAYLAAQTRGPCQPSMSWHKGRGEGPFSRAPS
jgi:hypothetical protein